MRLTFRSQFLFVQFSFSFRSNSYLIKLWYFWIFPGFSQHSAWSIGEVSNFPNELETCLIEPRQRSGLYSAAACIDLCMWTWHLDWHTSFDINISRYTSRKSSSYTWTFRQILFNYFNSHFHREITRTLGKVQVATLQCKRLHNRVKVSYFVPIIACKII